MDAYRRVLLEAVLPEVVAKIVDVVPLPVQLAATAPEDLQRAADILPSVAKKVVAHIGASLERIYQLDAIRVAAPGGVRVQTALTRDDVALLTQAYKSRSSACIRLAEKIEKGGVAICNALSQERDTDVSVAWIGMREDLDRLRGMLLQLSETEKEKLS